MAQTPEQRKAWAARPEVHARRMEQQRQRMAAPGAKEAKLEYDRARRAAGVDTAAERSREWAKANPERVRANARRHRRKGIDGATDIQKFGPCEICTLPDTLHFDHDHAENCFRGWLCGSCNRALGLFKDSPLVLRAAQHYLETRSAQMAKKGE